jgi:hypothetical protein
MTIVYSEYIDWFSEILVIYFTYKATLPKFPCLLIASPTSETLKLNGAGEPTVVGLIMHRRLMHKSLNASDLGNPQFVRGELCKKSHIK